MSENKKSELDINDDDSPRYSRKEMRQILDKQAELLAHVHEVYSIFEKYKLTYHVISVKLGENGLVIEVR